jgi:hypothetical protein
MRANEFIVEFAPVGGDDREPNEEEILRQLARMWWLGTEQQMAKAQQTLEAMGWEIGQDESGDDDAGVFVIRAGDENGNTYMAFPHSELEGLTEAFPRVPAHAPEILSATDNGKTITIKVRTHDGSVREMSNSNPAVLQQWLNVKYGLRLPHSIARKFAGMPASMVEDQADNPDSWESQAADAERDAETVRMADQDAEAGGLAEKLGDNRPKLGSKRDVGKSIRKWREIRGLDEKSTSQAQFRTMAAAAHNPEFAKKVGIDQDVAQEFHSADKGSSYKKLPKKAAEDASWGMAPEGRGYK